MANTDANGGGNGEDDAGQPTELPLDQPSDPQGGQSSDQSGAQQNEQPAIHVLGQYIKDLSFENPGAPASLRPSSANPNLDVNVNVNARPMSETDFEIELKLDATASRESDTLFVAEVAYAGVFRIHNVPKEHMQPIILIECPRLLFPFARQILADATRQGGFPPLMIDPVDFAALYRHRVAQAAKQAAGEPAN
ncbi:MAG TPA: protein-export chaperone SecB [Afifellaceae bacterium]|nr:protein-export chaperone SecB [Afifellaceae bacterium]